MGGALSSGMRRIGLLTNPFPFMQAINRGVADCSRRVGPWRIEMHHLVDEDDAVAFIAQRGFDGVITTYEAAFCPQLARADVPVVAAFANEDGLPSVTIDNTAIGRLGAAYLLECGYRHFAFYGLSEPWSVQRAEGFARELAEHDAEPPTRFQQPGESPSQATDEHLAFIQRLAGLNMPAAIMTCHDHAARVLLDAAIEHGVRVPGDLAVLGVDNDALLCETGACPLSSIDTNLYRVGFEAALLLDGLMRRDESTATPAPVPPKGVVPRQSTSPFAHNDPDVASALRFIHERAGEGLSVAELCEHVGLSRRRLEQRFASAVGRSPGDEIRQARIDRAKVLLTETDLTLGQVAVRCGYAYTSGFSAAFRDVVGLSPGQFRRNQDATQE